MNGRRLVRSVCAALAVAAPLSAQPSTEWPIHSKDRPQPAVGSPPPSVLPVKPPAGAIVLFDGTDLSNWLQAREGSPALLVVRIGYFEGKAGTGDLTTQAGVGEVDLDV